MKRRDFLIKSCTLCIATAALGSFDSCTGSRLFKTQQENGRVSVPLVLFEETNVRMVRISGRQYDVAVIKTKAGGYFAFEMRCTHADNELLFTGKVFTCSLHGSNFNLAGQVTKGPAEKKLNQLKTELKDTSVILFL